MAKFFEFLIGNPSERQKRKKITVMAILVTAVLIVSSFAAIGIASISGSNGKNDSKADEKTPYTITSSIKTGDLILVNKNNQISFEDNNNRALLTQGNGYLLRDNTLEAHPKAIEALNAMIADLNANVDSANVLVKYAYRSEKEQNDLNTGTPGGYSDYHTGLSFELKHKASDGSESGISEMSGKYDWVYANAHKYGFIVRYPQSCENVTEIKNYTYAFRYVGVAHATYIYENDLCLESYLELLRASHRIGSPLEIKGADSLSYKVFYTESVDIEIPSGSSFDVSGDNMNGFIVTVCEKKK